MKRTPSDPRAAAKRAAIRALAKARRAADKAGVELSAWEDEFLGSVSERVKTYGRAFGDAEKGDRNAPLSMLQAVKLKEIAKKARGEAPARGGRGRFASSRADRRAPNRRASNRHDE